MNTIALLLVLVSQVSSPPYIRPDANIEQREVTVEYIYDGDTFRGDDNVNYRLAGINAPEVAHPEHGKPDGEPGGEEATDALRALIANKRVTAIIDRAHPLDRYGRTVAVILADNQDVNIEMLRSGQAEPRYIDLSPMIDQSSFLEAVSVSDSDMSRPAATREDVTLSAHVLAPGDRIRIVVGNQTQDFTINPDGVILIKGLGVFQIASKPSATAATDLDSAIRAKNITVTPVTVFYLAPPTKIQRPRAMVSNVQVYGSVQHPGTQQAFTIADAVRQATPDTRADLAHVIIARGNGDTTTVNAHDIALGHDPDTNLLEGDRVLIPRRPESTLDTPQTINVLGDVARPGAVTPGTLTAVLANAGGPKTTARLSAIHVRQPDGKSQTYDLTKITTGRQSDPQLLPNTTVFVESNEPRRQSITDLSTFIGIFSSIVLLALKLGG